MTTFRPHFVPAGALIVALSLSSCSMGEEIRRIEAVKQAQQAEEASRSTNLTGEQVFIRSCNTCHPGGKKGPLGPTLANFEQHYPDNAALKAFIRKGKNRMPRQPTTTLNDQELENLVIYLHKLSSELQEVK